MEYTTKQIIVRYHETDQMHFVHHSNYLKYFELARLEWLSNLQISYAEMESRGILMPVVNASLKYIKPLVFGDNFNVTVILKKEPKATLEFDYKILNQNKELISTGNTLLAFLSSDTKLPIRCPKFLLEKFN
ncbi:MAG: acyl-CoA thioesterase [Flavobacteriaceae bacterium]